MLVKLRTNFAGPTIAAGAGQVIDLPDAAAYDLIERGYASQVDAPLSPADQAPAETATLKAPETTEAQPRRNPTKAAQARKG